MNSTWRGVFNFRNNWASCSDNILLLSLIATKIQMKSMSKESAVNWGWLFSFRSGQNDRRNRLWHLFFGMQKTFYWSIIWNKKKIDIFHQNNEPGSESVLSSTKMRKFEQFSWALTVFTRFCSWLLLPLKKTISWKPFPIEWGSYFSHRYKIRAGSLK